MLTICGVLISTYAFHGYVFPVGADAPVYIWWSRLAGQEGLGAVAVAGHAAAFVTRRSDLPDPELRSSA